MTCCLSSGRLSIKSTTSRNATAVGSSAVGTPCSSTASSAAQVPGLPALTTISAVKILSNRSAISGSYSLSTRRSRRKNSARLSRSSSGISISARHSLDSAFEPIRLTRRLTTAATAPTAVLPAAGQWQTAYRWKLPTRFSMRSLCLRITPLIKHMRFPMPIWRTRLPI